MTVPRAAPPAGRNAQQANKVEFARHQARKAKELQAKQKVKFEEAYAQKSQGEAATRVPRHLFQPSPHSQLLITPSRARCASFTEKEQAQRELSETGRLFVPWAATPPSRCTVRVRAPPITSARPFSTISGGTDRSGYRPRAWSLLMTSSASFTARGTMPKRH